MVSFTPWSEKRTPLVSGSQAPWLGEEGELEPPTFQKAAESPEFAVLWQCKGMHNCTQNLFLKAQI